MQEARRYPTAPARNLPVVLPHATAIQQSRAYNDPRRAPGDSMHREMQWNRQSEALPASGDSTRGWKPHSQIDRRRANVHSKHSRSAADAHQTTRINREPRDRFKTGAHATREIPSRRDATTTDDAPAYADKPAIPKEWQTNTHATQIKCSQRNHYPTGNHSL